MENRDIVGSKRAMRPRNGGVEVLRCLLMFLIVLYHNWLHGIYGGQAEGGPVAWWTVVFTGLIIWHVDGFVAISGWFGIRFTVGKWLKLFAQVLFYSAMSLAYVAVLKPETLPSLSDLCFARFPSVIDAGWFGSSYMLLMVVAPLVDSAIKARSEKGDAGFFFAAIVVAMTCAWAPQHAFVGVWPSGLDSCSFLTLLYVYFIAQLLHQKWGGALFSVKYLVAIVGLYPIVALAVYFGWWKWCEMKGLEMNLDFLNTYWNYLSPFVIACAVAMVILFAQHVRVPAWLGRFAGYLGPSMFGVYLIHDVTKFGKFYVPIQKWLVAQYDPHPLEVLLAAAAVTFAGCVAIDMVRRAIFAVVNRVWGLMGGS